MSPAHYVAVDAIRRSLVTLGIVRPELRVARGAASAIGLWRPVDAEHIAAEGLSRGRDVHRMNPIPKSKAPRE